MKKGVSMRNEVKKGAPMQEAVLTRRSFVKAATVAGATLALSTGMSHSLQQTSLAQAASGTNRKVYQSSCHGCITTCPCRVYVEDGVVVKIEGHPEAPISMGSLCLKGLNQIHTCYSPRRVLYPIKRTGALGAENATWERISWDEAIQLAADQITTAIKKYGTYSVFLSVGGGGAYSIPQAVSMALALGTPTIFEPGSAQCLLPRDATARYMYGGRSMSIADANTNEPFKGLAKLEAEKGLTSDTKTLVLWAAQPSVSQTAVSGRGMAELRARGCKTIVIDPNYSPDAVKATVWLRVRPGTDTALMLAWFRYIFENQLYDIEFTKYWTNMPCIIDPDTKLPYLATDVWPDYVSTTPNNTPTYVCYDLRTRALQPLEFSAPENSTVDPEVFWTGEVNGKQSKTAGQIYRETADPWTLEEAERVCWVPKDLIEEAIKLYTDPLKEDKTAGICLGVATDQQPLSSQAPLGAGGLDMIMGYINKEGTILAQTPGGPYSSVVRPGAPRPTKSYGVYFGGFGSGAGFEVGATEEDNANRVANVPDPDLLWCENQVVLDRPGSRNYKGIYDWSECHIPSTIEYIKTGEPFKPRVWYDLSGNKLAMVADAQALYDVFPEIDFCICQYPNLTSFQVERADLVFPVSEWLEYADPTPMGQINYTFGIFPVIHLGETVANSVVPTKIMNACTEILNKEIDAGAGIVFGATGASSVPPATEETEHKFRFPMAPRGVMAGQQEDAAIHENLAKFWGAPDFETLKENPEEYLKPKVGPIEEFWAYKQHEVIADDGLPSGFATESRRCEVYCTVNIRLGRTGWPYCYPRYHQPNDPEVAPEFGGDYSPICQYFEPAESPLEGSPNYDPQYPYAVTSGRVYYFHHGTMRHAPFARELYPIPDVRMNPRTAEAHGLRHMDFVKVTSRRGSIVGRVYCTAGMHEKVLWMERFWNPECFDNSVPQEKRTGGWRECNVNVITKASAPYNEVFGSYTNRGFCVNIEKAERPANVWIEPEEFEPFLPTKVNQLSPDAGSLLEMKETPWVSFNDWDPNAVPKPM
jgi:anaerobic selenocysteine-containing dehydrogenase